MANHPNRNKPVGSSDYVVGQTGNLMLETAAMMMAKEGTEDFEKARSRAQHAAMRVSKALKLMGPQEAEADAAA